MDINIVFDHDLNWLIVCNITPEPFSDVMGHIIYTICGHNGQTFTCQLYPKTSIAKVIAALKEADPLPFKSAMTGSRSIRSNGVDTCDFCVVYADGSCASQEKFEQLFLLQEKWLPLLQPITNTHSWSWSKSFHQCVHHRPTNQGRAR